MRIESLFYITVINEQKSISKAASQLFIQQTTLSAAVKSLENELGFQIFNRTSTGVELTEKGERVIEIANDIVSRYDDMLKIAEEETSLDFYVNMSVYDRFYSDIYKKYHHDNDGLNINLYRMKPMSFMNLVKRKNHSVGIDYILKKDLDKVIEQYQGKNYQVTQLMDTTLMAYVSRKNKLSRRKSISFKELEKEKLIIGKNSEADFLRIRPDLKNYIVLDGVHVSEAIDLVEDTKSVAVFPDYKTLPAAKIVDVYTNVVPLEITGRSFDDFQYVQCLIYSKNISFSEGEKKLLKEITEVFHN